MAIGDLNSVNETVYGFRTKLIFFIDCVERLRHALKKEKNEIHILDVGCGNGLQMTFPLGALGYSVAGIDLHESSISFANEKNIFSNVKFLLSDIEHLQKIAHSQKFDVIIFSDILEHVNNPEKLLKDAHSVLKPDGIILISIPNGFGPFEIENYILRKTGILHFGDFIRRKLSHGKSKIPYNRDSGHIQFFSMKKINEILKQTGFFTTNFKNGYFFGASVTARIISLIKPLIKFNIAIGKYLPSFMCSVWYFECKKI